MAVLDGALVITFAPAYVHRDGKGWVQNARLVLEAAAVEPFDIEFPARVEDGEMETSKGPYHNLLMLPLRDDGPVSLEVAFGSSAMLRAKGESVRVELLGEPVYVKDFSQR